MRHDVTLLSAISERILDVWIVELTGRDATVAAAQRLLGADEVARAERFRPPHVRRRFVLAHGVLRVLLARYEAREPAAIELAYGEYGKPRLTTPSRLQFNLAHSGELAAYAFMIGEDVGIDIEEIRPLSDLVATAHYSFRAEECADLATLAGDRIVDAFYACWTRKEAFLKATGAGLSHPLDAFRVSLLPDQPAAILCVDGGDPEDWWLRALEIEGGYAGAIAARGAERELRICRTTASALLGPAFVYS